MQSNDQRGFHGQQIRKGSVVQVGCDDVVEGHLTAFVTETEGSFVTEIKTAGSNKVFRTQAGRCQPVPVKTERRLIIHMEHIIHDFQAFLAVQRRRGHAQALEIIHQVDLDTLQPGLGFLDVVRVYSKGDVLCLCQAVVSFGKLPLQHFSIFLPDIVKPVILIGNDNGLFKAFCACGQVQERELQMNTGIEIVQKIAPAFKDRGLIIVLGQLIIDVLELNGLGVILGRHPADPVRPHPLIRDSSLSCPRLFLVRPVPFHQLFQLLLFRLGEL